MDGVTCILRASTDKKSYLPGEKVVFEIVPLLVNLSSSEKSDFQIFKKTNLHVLFQKVLASCVQKECESKYFSSASSVGKGELKLSGIMTSFFGTVNMNSSWVELPKRTDNFSNIPHQKNSHLLFGSFPVNVICDNVVSPGKLLSMVFSVKLPSELYIVPTYRGVVSSVKYFATFEAEFENWKKKKKKVTIKVPICIKNPCCAFRKNFPKPEQLRLDWSFKGSCEKTPVLSNVVHYDFVKNIRGNLKERKKSTFLVNINGEGVAKVSIGRLCFCVGETIEIGITFESSNIKCLQLNSTLICNEIVDAKYIKIDPDSFREVCSKIVNRVSKKTAGAKKIGIQLEIPSHSSPSCKSELFDLEWSIEFIFHLVFEETITTKKWCLPVTVFENPDKIKRKRGNFGGKSFEYVLL